MLFKRFFSVVVFFCVISGFALYGADQQRTAQDTLVELERMSRSSRLSFDELRTLNETIARMRESMRKRSRTELEQEYINDLKKVLIDKYNSNEKDRMALFSLVRYLIYMDEAEEALKYFRTSNPSSKDDLQWRMIALEIYIQLGDYARASFFSNEIDGLLSRRNPLNMSKPVAVSQVTAYRLYTPRENKTIKPGDMLTLYIEIDGAKFVESKDSARCSLDFGLELRDQLQNVIDRNDNYGRYDPVYAGKVNDLHATIYYRVPGNLDSGNYVLVINCRDNYAENAKAQVFYPFSVGSTVVVADNEKQKKTAAKAELLKSKLLSGSGKDLLEDLNSFEDLDLDATKKDKKKDTKDLNEDLQKMGLDMKLDRAKRTGDLLNK